jgi:hypothetical protein
LLNDCYKIFKDSKDVHFVQSKWNKRLHWSCTIKNYFKDTIKLKEFNPFKNGSLNINFETSNFPEKVLKSDSIVATEVWECTSPQCIGCTAKIYFKLFFK